MLKINGATVHAVLPMFAADKIEYYVIAASVRDGKAVSATVETLADVEWSGGRYFRDHDGRSALGRAVTDAYVRAELPAIDWTQVTRPERIRS